MTAELKDPDSPLRLWLANELPNLGPLQRRWRRDAAAGRATVGWPREHGAAPWPLLGMAIDHRLRFALADSPVLDVCWDGAETVEAVCHSRGLAGELEVVVADVVDELRPADRSGGVLLPEPAEARLGRVCVVLAWAERVYREGVPSGPEDPLYLSPFHQGRRRITAEQLLAAVPAGALTDLRAVATRADVGVFARLRATTALDEVNTAPVFAGSDDVGGADADWLARGTLLDCKATVSPGKLADGHMLYQLLCYPLLDYDDQLRITRVGVYLARQGQLVVWPLEETLAAAAGRTVDLARLRQSLHRALRA